MDTTPRIRRHSVTNLGDTIRKNFSSRPEEPGSSTCANQDLSEFMTTFTHLMKINSFRTEYINVDHDSSSFTTKIIEGSTYNLVAILCMYRNIVVRPDGLNHAVPYVKMNDLWYEGDNEKGVLRLRMNGPPTWRTQYSGGLQMMAMTYFYVNILFPIFPITPLNVYGFHGKIVSKQNGTTCWTDSIHTILMNANGYREQFTHLYNLLTKPTLFNSENIVKLPTFDPNKIITKDKVIKTFMRKLKILFDVQPVTDVNMDQVDRQRVKSIFSILSLMFARIYIWGIEYPTDYITHKPDGSDFLQPNITEGSLVNIPNMVLRTHFTNDERIAQQFGGKRLKKHRKTYKRKN